MMEIRTIKTIKQGYGAYTVTYLAIGYSMKQGISAPIKLSEKSVTFVLSDRTLEQCIKQYEKQFSSDYWYNEIMLYVFKEFALSDGKISALKTIMNDGYTLGFHYNLMGCAEVIRINKKSLTIEDITDSKHYITYDYFNNDIQWDQFYVTH